MKIKNILRLSLFPLLTYCNLSLALAINDVAIISNLGEPLIAQINITDVEKSPDISCFSVTDSNASPAFNHVSLAIKYVANNYQLIIKSRQPVTEPILNLRVVHHCEPNISRDYVILLDPPLHNDVKTNADNLGATRDSPQHQSGAENLLSKQAKIDSNTTSAPDSAKESTSKKKSTPKPAKASSIDKKLTAIYTGSSQATANADNQDAPIMKSRPFLSISGGDTRLIENLALPTPALRLDTEIDLSRLAQPLPLTSSDVMDEITAIDNRLALLKTQIISLQATNEKLKSDAANVNKQLEDSKRTLRTAAGLIALLAFLAFAEWLRRKLVHERLAKIEESRPDVNDLNNDYDDFTDAAINIDNKNTSDTKNANSNDAFYTNSSYDMASSFNTQAANGGLAASINSNAKEDILESADVLTEYGRFGLAIHLLQDYLVDHPSESPKVWLKLLSLAAVHGTESDYVQAVADCNNYYRINMPSFAEAKKVGTATIEDFPFITKDLEMAWGSAHAVALLDDLIYNSESQPEDGFEPEIFEQLFMLKQIAENLNANPANADAATEQTPINASESNRAPDHVESTKAISQTKASFTNEPMMHVYETSIDEAAVNWNNAPAQSSQLPETFPALNFDDYATQDSAAETVPDNNALPETKPTLDAPAIDFSHHAKELAGTQDLTIKSAKNSAAPVIGDKQKKRIVKDSNLIDWVVTDEN